MIHNFDLILFHKLLAHAITIIIASLSSIVIMFLHVLILEKANIDDVNAIYFLLLLISGLSTFIIGFLYRKQRKYWLCYCLFLTIIMANTLIIRYWHNTIIYEDILFYFVHLLLLIGLYLLGVLNNFIFRTATFIVLFIYIFLWGPDFFPHKYAGRFSYEFEGNEFMKSNSNTNYWVNGDIVYNYVDSLLSNSPKIEQYYKDNGKLIFNVKWIARRSAYGRCGHFGMARYDLTVVKILSMASLIEQTNQALESDANCPVRGNCTVDQ